MNGYLELADGAFVGVRDGLVLGRVAGCDIVVEDNKASRRHARLIVDAGVVEIEDLNSSNGTLLNGKPVERRLLRDGDEVRIGKTVIVYREGPLPGTNAHGQRSAPALFDDEHDLLGGNDLSAAPLPAPAPQPIAPPPRPASPPPPRAAVSPPAAPPATPAPPPLPPPVPARGSVVEFEDEVVEVRKVPAPAPPAAVGKSKPAARPDEVVASSQRVLQFSKQAGGGGLLGDDLAQMSGGMRALLVLVVIVVGAAIVWGIMSAIR